MGIAASIVSVILKSVVGDKLGNELASEVIGISIDEISEKSFNEISDFINEKKSKIGSILSKENMISMGISEDKTDYVVAEIMNLFSGVNITDEVLRQCKYDSMNLSAFLWNEYREGKNEYIECESEIKRCLFTVAEVLIKLVRKSEEFSQEMLIQISNSVDDSNVGLQKISEYMDSNFGKLNADNQTILEILRMILEQNQQINTRNYDKKQSIESKTQEYANKVEINVHDGGQVNFATGSSCVNAVMNNKNLLIDDNQNKYKTTNLKIDQIKLSMYNNYINDLLGNPISIINHSESNVIECMYKLDGAVVRIFYRDSSICAYFVTLTEESVFLKIEIDDFIFHDKRVLGKFTYYETQEVPTYILGYSQNGTGHILYSEFYVGYRLRTYALIDMEYGVDFGYPIIPGEIIYDDKVTKSYTQFSNLHCFVEGTDELAKHTSLCMTVDRKIARPNTFGVMECLDANIIDYITDYNYYDYSLLHVL